MAGAHEQLVIEGFYDNFETGHQLEKQSYDIEESKLMLTALARHRLDLIIRGNINDSRDADNHIESLQNK